MINSERMREKVLYGMGGHEPGDRKATRASSPPTGGGTKEAERLRQCMGADTRPQKDG